MPVLIPRARIGSCAGIRRAFGGTPAEVENEWANGAHLSATKNGVYSVYTMVYVFHIHIHIFFCLYYIDLGLYSYCSLLHAAGRFLAQGAYMAIAACIRPGSRVKKLLEVSAGGMSSVQHSEIILFLHQT